MISSKIRKRSAHWSSSRGQADHCWNKDELIGHVNWLISNIYVTCGDSMFKQVIGIPMGTDCAPFLANLFLFAYEYKWLTKKFKRQKSLMILKSSTFVFDILMISYVSTMINLWMR